MAVNTVREDETLKTAGKTVTLLRLFRYLLSYRKMIAFVIFIMLLTVGISLINPLIIERAINVNIKNNDIEGLLKLGAAALVMNVAMILLIKLRMYLMARMSNDVLVKIRNELYEHIQTLSFSFFDSRPTGKILARIIGDVNSLKDVLSNSVTTLIPDFITVCAVVLIMAVKNWKLALAAMSSLPLMIIGVLIVQTKSHARWQIHRKKSSNLNAFIHEDVSGMRVIQSFSAEDETEETFDELLSEHCGSFVNACRFADAFGPVVDFCWGLGTLCMYYVGVKMLGAQAAPVGTLMAFGTYISMFWNPIMNLSNFYNQLITNIAGAERIFEMVDTEPEDKGGDVTITYGETEEGKWAWKRPNPDGTFDYVPLKGDIKFENVIFGYNDEKVILKNISLYAKPGQKIAFVGSTGAGKTTITNLINRFYDIQSGSITYDGLDIKSIKKDDLRKSLGIVLQDTHLFTGTVMDNIRYGRLDATDEECINAARLANAHSFIKHLPEKYDTLITGDGANLSQGQRQLLAIARAIVSKCPVLILDEATSSIDTRTEKLIEQGMDKLMEGRTVFVIAHRLSTVRNSQAIMVFEHGEIIERGNHEQFIAQKGKYYQLYTGAFELD